jgi:hypothetical protein
LELPKSRYSGGYYFLYSNLALDGTLVSHEDRIKNAITKVKTVKSWNMHQLKWIERFEKTIAA